MAASREGGDVSSAEEILLYDLTVQSEWRQEPEQVAINYGLSILHFLANHQVCNDMHTLFRTSYRFTIVKTAVLAGMANYGCY